MLIKYVQVYRYGSGLHVQATGPAFPKGYASGNIPATTTAVMAEADSDAGRKGVSMRPQSSSRYLPCQVTPKGVFTPKGALVCTIEALVTVLNAPSPAYGASSAASVGTSVQKAIDIGTAPDPTPVLKAASKDLDVQGLALAIAQAITKFLN